MCVDLDLFNDVAVTLDDVELYLDSLPCFNSGSALFRREHYVKSYDVANIIKQKKLSGEFYLLSVADSQRERVTFFNTKYRCDKVDTPICNARQCHCDLKSCEFKIKINRKKRNQRYYDKNRRYPPFKKQKA